MLWATIHPGLFHRASEAMAGASDVSRASSYLDAVAPSELIDGGTTMEISSENMAMEI